jgi:hypothetical protein
VRRRLCAEWLSPPPRGTARVISRTPALTAPLNFHKVHTRHFSISTILAVSTSTYGRKKEKHVETLPRHSRAGVQFCFANIVRVLHLYISRSRRVLSFLLLTATYGFFSPCRQLLGMSSGFVSRQMNEFQSLQRTF